jgi:hypothetical protein
VTNPTDRSRSGARSPRQGKPTARPTRSQVRAMEARAVAPSLPPAEPAVPVVEPVALDFLATELSPPPRRTAEVTPGRTRRRASVQTVVPISRDEEYAYIAGDLRRLLTIAGGLFVLMMALLVVVGP